MYNNVYYLDIIDIIHNKNHNLIEGFILGRHRITEKVFNRMTTVQTWVT